MTERDDAQIRALAQRAGVSEQQARTLLADAAEHNVSPMPAASTASTAPGGGWVARMLDGAAWAVCWVTAISLVTYAGATNAFDPDAGETAPKVVMLVVALACLAVAGATGRLAARRGYRLGVQLSASFAVALGATVLWCALWLTGVWPQPTERLCTYPAASATRLVKGVCTSAADDDVAWMLLVAGTAVAAAVVAARLRAALAWATLLACLHVLAVLAQERFFDDVAFSDGAQVALCAAYLAGAAALSALLEVRRRAWATWTWPLVMTSAGLLVAAVDSFGGRAAAVIVAVAVIVSGAAVAVAAVRWQLVASCAVGAYLLEAWLYGSVGAPALLVLMVSMATGLAAVGLALATWRWRDRTLAALPGPVSSWARSLDGDRCCAR